MQALAPDFKGSAEIVSYNSAGNPLSRKEDDVWYLEHLRVRLSERVTFYMARIFREDKFYEENVSQGKDVMQVIVEGQHKGKPLRIGTLRTYYKLLKDMVGFALVREFHFTSC
ncbi:hypothetical protein [Pseudomonas sp. PB3P13]